MLGLNVPTIVRRAAPKSPAISKTVVIRWGNAMLASVGRTEAELSVMLTDDAGIQTLNRNYRQKDRATDVLSFHFEPGPGSATIEAAWLLGDVVISLDTAARQAKGRKRPLAAEVRWLLAHGILHLCGYDHATVPEKRQMVNFTRRLVRAAKAVEHATRGSGHPAKARKKSVRSARPRTQ